MKTREGRGGAGPVGWSEMDWGEKMAEWRSEAA